MPFPDSSHYPATAYICVMQYSDRMFICSSHSQRCISLRARTEIHFFPFCCSVYNWLRSVLWNSFSPLMLLAVSASFQMHPKEVLDGDKRLPIRSLGPFHSEYRYDRRTFRENTIGMLHLVFSTYTRSFEENVNACTHC